MDSGYEMAKELFEEEPSIDSLVCATDTMAVGAMTYLKEIGLRIPEDVQIAGIGDGVPGKIVEPKLTTVHFIIRPAEWRQQPCWLILLRTIPGSARK